jgi:hypothetical protein
MELLSIDINVTQEHLKSGSFEVKSGTEGHYMKRWGYPRKSGTNGNPSVCMYFRFQRMPTSERIFRNLLCVTVNIFQYCHDIIL